MLPLPPVWISLALALAPVRAPVVPRPAPAARAVRADTLFSAAAQALEQGRPWEASRLIAPVLADPSRRTPDALMLAATAASRWNGWREVVRLLDGQPWVDSVPDGRARLLLARGSYEIGADSAALRNALAVPVSNVATVDGERLVTLAMALERLGARDSAADTYARAADVLPTIAGWLRVRAAAVTDDSTARARLYEGVTDPLARDRIGWSEAAAHRGTGDLSAAAARYQALGARATAAHLRFEASPDSARRSAVRQELVGLVSARRSPGEVRDAIALLDSAYAPLTPAEELEVGRAASTAGNLPRAADAFERAFAARLGTGEDHFAFATVLTKLGRNAEAVPQFAQVHAPKALEASAAYQRARALVRDGQLATGRRALERVVRLYPRDTTAASNALFLLGDLATDDRADPRARALFGKIVAHYPTSRFAPMAGFRAAMIALVAGDAPSAAAEFDELARRYSRSDEASAAVYWAGRAWDVTGDSVTARQRWETLAGGDPGSYYTGLAFRRLDRPEWIPPAAADSFVAVPAADSAMARAALLARLGLAAESRWEYDRLLRQSDSSAERLLALAAAFRRDGFASQAIQLARRALALGAPADARTYRLLYPVMLEDALLAEAASHGLSAAFVAALIRQESMFNPLATSPVGARGLMQVMPDLGGRLAESLAYPVWDPVLLYQPDVSLQLGSFHLQELADQYRRPEHVLAAYNAGASRVDRWSQRLGVDDPEIFTERIPFAETRGYVRAIQRNEEIYRGLYAWGAVTAAK
ncbi:MAG TPA: transglycosylase SLT domain-containing protein [Gemmatimonadales bacterium]|nr:transglycosylase SLT domain-containing protein [Gemmatimonadales bacterium]